MKCPLTVVVYAGLYVLAEAADSQLTINANIQPLLLTNFRREEAECLDMDGYSLNYCLHPANTPTSTPLRCYMDGEFVLECNTKETGCKAHASLKGMVKHPNSKSKTCNFLQFFKVSKNLLHRHFVCCTHNETFHHYLYPCTDKRRARPLPTQFQQLCGHQMEAETEGVHHEPSMKVVNTIKTTILWAVISLLLLLLLLSFLSCKYYFSREPQDENNNQQTLEEGRIMIPKGEGVQENGPYEHIKNQNSEPVFKITASDQLTEG